MGDKLRLFESAEADVRYILGRPLRFDAALVNRMNSRDKSVSIRAWEEAARRCG